MNNYALAIHLPIIFQNMRLKQITTQRLFLSIIFLSLFPFVSPSTALIIGIILSLLGIKDPKWSSKTSFILQASIVLMGLSMDLDGLIEASSKGVILTAFSVFITVSLGLIIGKILGVDKKTSMLISSGTAICGGSAIAAVAPTINAKETQTSFALIVVFVLNAIALIIFPKIGHLLNMSQESFGYWAAIAIHDTSSVVGAGAQYGPKALEIATTVKLARALWIIPLTLALSFADKGSTKKAKIPWFILFYILEIVISHYTPEFKESYMHIGWLGKRGLVIALFLIGSNISISAAKEAGLKSFALGVLLWIFISLLSLSAIYYFN